MKKEATMKKAEAAPSLEALFDKGTGGNCHKWRHYFEIYERYFGKFVGQKCTYLEIGVQRGGSLDIMQEYLGGNAKIVGMDIDPACEKLASPTREIYIGDQSDAAFLHEVAQKSGPFDIIVDDGGHTADQQITSFFTLFPHLKEGGIYLVEDMHCHFWHGYQNSRYGINFYDFAKGLVEKMALWNIESSFFNRYHMPMDQRPPGLHINNFATTDIFGIHFYDSVIVFEKRKIGEPMSERK